MNALIFTNSGVHRGVVGESVRSMTDNSVSLNVTVDGKLQTFGPSNFVSVNGLLNNKANGEYPFVLVSNRDYRAIDKLTPKPRKSRVKKTK